MRRFDLTRAAVAVVACAAISCKDFKREAAHRSAAECRAHIGQARAGLEQMTRSFVPILASLAPPLAASIAGHRPEEVRYLLMGMNSQRTQAGALSFFPTGFVVAVGTDGVAIARNVNENDDLMHGMPLANMFPSVRAALAGTGGLGTGELPATADQPSRVYLVAATPVRDAQGVVQGALAAGISYGQLARALDTAVRVHAGQEPVLWVGLRRAGRVLPSGHDRDVPARWLIPASLVAQIPADGAARIAAGHGAAVWEFVEDDTRGWAGALADLPPIDDTQVLIFRSEASQN